MATPLPVRRLALVVGGGPAPGINGVISAVTIEAWERGIEVFGIEDGYHWLVQGDATHIRPLLKNEVTNIYMRGGSILGTARTNPTKKTEDMDNVVRILSEQRFDALVSIGGDDTAYTASQIYERMKADGASMRVAHVPKTIDNDLDLPGSAPTFGFETARHYGVSTVRCLAEDARTTSRWYIIVSMGRAAGHLALGIGKASAATITIIPEEFGLDDKKKKPNAIKFKHLCDVILGAIIRRIAMGRRAGVIVLAEGLIQSVEEDLKIIVRNTGGKYGDFVRDEHGHPRLGEIEFGMLVRDLLLERLVKPKETKDDANLMGKPGWLHKLLGHEVTPYGCDVPFVSKDLGYELRCADPIPFDAEYTRDLGYSAVKFLESEDAAHYAAVIGFMQGVMKPIKFEDMKEEGSNRMRTRLVNTDSEGYEVALNYMIRLEEADFENPDRLKKLADVVGMTPQAFRAEFEYVVLWKKWTNAQRREWNARNA